MNRRLLLTAVALLVAAGLAVAAWLWRPGPPPPGPEVGTATKRPIATAHYQCDGGRTIDAAFYAGPDTAPPEPGAPPAPGGSVHLELSDGRAPTLHQTISADGARYSDGDPSVRGSEALVFWSKGNGALVLEHDVQKRYTGCVRVADDPGGLPRVFASGSGGFSIRYPADWTVDTTYRYTALGPGRAIAGVSFTVPGSLAAGTNLSAGSYLSVEDIPGSDHCTADRFLGEGVRDSVRTVGGAEYSVARRTEAAVGNRYGEAVYAIPGTNPCIAVRYFIHWTVLENYPPGAVRAFDERGLTDALEAMRRTLVVDR